MIQEKIAVLGLGYVGLPVALAFAKAFPGTVGFDINKEKVGELQSGVDRTGEVSAEELLKSSLKYSYDEEELRGCTFFVVAVPTPIDSNKQPDLSPLIGASKVVGKVIAAGGVVVYESTVYPGVTEDIAGPVIEKVSGLKQSVDFKLGYSPERINPGDKEHTLERIIKVVSGEDEATLERVAAAYGAIIPAGIHKASSIKVAESAKVIENTQRDLNIAFVNELAIIFDRLGISTGDVLAAAGTKWNFLKFTPGLVGGHCIGVDPYYLTAKAEESGYHPQVILAGRRINDGMGKFIAEKLVKLLIHQNIPVKQARVAVLGVTFKENVSDIRNSRVVDIVQELESYGVQVLWHDCLADKAEVQHEYQRDLVDTQDLTNLDAVVFAVSHRDYVAQGVSGLTKNLRPNGVFIDVKSVFDSKSMPEGVSYWSL